MKTIKPIRLIIVVALVALAPLTLKAQSPETKIPAEKIPKWEYSYYEEGLEKTRVNKAGIFSEEDNRPDLSMNKNNAVLGLAIFNTPSKTNEWSAAFVVAGEQFDCTRGCRVRYRLDDGEIKMMWAYERNFKGLWVNEPKTFIQQIRTASTLEIEIPMWRRGTLVFKLNVSGFEYSRMLEK